jgi:hypothetical protein
LVRYWIIPDTAATQASARQLFKGPLSCLRRPRLSQRLRHELSELIAEERILNRGDVDGNFREQCVAHW